MKSFLFFFVGVFLLTAFITVGHEKSPALKGAWEWKSSDQNATMIFSDKYYSVAEYSAGKKTFGSTRGGSWRAEGKNLVLLEEFNTASTSSIGREQKFPFSLKGKKLVVTTSDGGEPQEWVRIDDATPGVLAGAWLITGRLQEGEMQKITPGVRRTMKILSGTRFQWIAYNTETKEFFGTGGGSYTSENGKYVEKIGFFSRDNSRVGKELGFDFSLDKNAWRHKGFSSKGDPIDEVWTRREVLGI